MKLLYITFIDFTPGTSGSSVRPQKMYQAFLNLGIDIYLVSGNPQDRSVRKATVQEIIDNLDSINPDMAYIEPPSGPLFVAEDRKLISELNKRNIPTGLFYRDMYWAYDVPSTGNRIKDFLVKILQKRDWKQYNKDIDILYFPTEDMPGDYEVKSRVEALPPGAFEAVPEIVRTNNEIPTGFYVGGLNPIYGVPKLLQSYRLLNKEAIRSKLKLICREAEWNNFDEREIYQNEAWLEVKHVSGDEKLREEYAGADFAFCPQENNAYNNVTMSVKFMEAISYLKPVIATELRPLQAIIDKYEIGLTCADSVESLTTTIDYMISNPEFYESCLENTVEARQDNLWEVRAQKVIDDLSGLKLD